MPTQPPGDAKRAYLPHPEIFATIKPGHALLIDDGKVKLTVTEADSKADHHARRRRREAVRPQGREPAGHDDPVFGTGRQGPLRPRSRARNRHRLGGAVVHPAAGRHRRGKKDHARARGGDGQDREAAGGQSACRDHGSRRRADGGARRSRRGNAAGESAWRAKANDARQPRRRQAGGRRHANAGIDDQFARADARGGLRRRHRDFRRCRRGDAVGGIGGRAISGASGRDDEPHRRRGRRRSALPQYHRRSARRAGSNRRRRDCRRGAPYRRYARSCGGHLLDIIRLDRLAGGARASAFSDRRAVTEHRDRTATGCRRGASIAL